MIEETIGSIGSTHGVSDSSRPAMKNAPTIGQNAPPRRTASTTRLGRRCRRSRTGRALVVVDDELAVAPVWPTMFGGRLAGANTRTVPAPPNPVRPTAAALGRGG